MRRPFTANSPSQVERRRFHHKSDRAAPGVRRVWRLLRAGRGAEFVPSRFPRAAEGPRGRSLCLLDAGRRRDLASRSSASGEQEAEGDAQDRSDKRYRITQRWPTLPLQAWIVAWSIFLARPLAEVRIDQHPTSTIPYIHGAAEISRGPTHKNIA
jgi:hypothetical protein